MNPNIPMHFTTEKKATVMVVTPEIAANWLKFNINNRNITTGAISKMVNTFKSGRYQFNGDAIRWGKDGRILDAQHRLTACVQTDIPFESVVVWGIDPDAQITMDRNKKRTLVDHLRIRGEQSTKELSTVLNLAVAWYEQDRRFGLGYTTAVDYEEAYNYLVANPNIRESVSAISDFGSGKVRKIINPAWFAFVHWVLTNIDPIDADDFLTRVVSGYHDEETEATYKLRGRLEDFRQGDANPRAGEVIALIFKAWNLYRDGEHVKQLRIRRGGHAPESYPEPR